MGPWQRAHDAAAARPDFLDLVDSRYHQNGLIPDRAVFADTFARWLDLRGYQPDSRGAPAARQALSRFYGGQKWKLGADRFFLTAGTSEAYALAFSTLADAGDEVLLPRPGYPLFEQLAAHSRLQTRFYDQPWATGWRPLPESLERAVTTRTRFVVVISPNNPTGQTLTERDLTPLAELCLRHALTLVVDEVFDACWEGPDPLPRPGALFPEVRTLTLNGISKRFGSPDLKLAWLAVSGPSDWVAETSRKLDLANDAFLSANSYSQFLLPSLFETMEPWQASVRALLAENRQAVAAWMEREGIAGLPPDGGIHGLWRVSEHGDDEALAVDLLETQSVALHPGFFYDVQEPGAWMVYSLLKRPEEFREGLSRVSFWLNRRGR
jgi:aspartate/methionine/tyrosine aminotransferase